MPDNCKKKNRWAVPGWTRVFKSTFIRGSSGGKTLTGYRNNVTGQLVDRYEDTLPSVTLTLRNATSAQSTSATPADRAPTEGSAPPTADGSSADGSAAPPTADGSASPPDSMMVHMAQPDSMAHVVENMNRTPTLSSASTSISGSAAPQLLVSTRAKSGYKYVIHDPRDNARSKPWSINHPLYRSAGFETPLAAATHLSQSGILTQEYFDAAQTAPQTALQLANNSDGSSGELPRADSPVDRTTLPSDAGIISLDDAFDLSTDAKMIISLTTSHAGLVMPRILRASAGASALVGRLGLSDPYADLSPLYDAIDNYNLGLIQRDAALLQVEGLFITTTSIHGLPLTVTGVRTTTPDRYLLTATESNSGGVVLDESFESMSTAQCVIVIAALDPPVPVLTRATAAWSALFHTEDAMISLHDASFLARLLGPVRFEELQVHFSELQETGQQKPFYMSINGKWIVNRCTFLNATTFLISCDDITPTMGTNMLLMRVDEGEDGAIQPRLENATPGAMVWGSQRNLDFSSTATVLSTLDPHERPLFNADMKKLNEDGEFVRLNAQLNMIATGRRTLVPFLYTVTLADLQPEALMGDDMFKSSDEPMALLGFTTINAIRIVTVSTGYTALFGIDDSDQSLEASCLQNVSALKHATLMCARDGSAPVVEVPIGECTYSARINVLRTGVLLLTLNDVTANADTAASFKKREADLDRRELTVQRWLADVTEQRERLREREESLRTLHASAFKRYRRTPGSPGSSRSASSVASSSSASSSVSIGAEPSLVKVEEEAVSLSVPLSTHLASFEAALAQIEALPLATPNDKCKVYLLQSVLASRARATSAGAEAVAQLSAFILRTDDDDLSFFQRIDRSHFEFEVRTVLVVPQAGIQLVHLFGTEHSTSPIGASVRSFLRSHLYQSADDAFWDRMLDDKSLSFVLIDSHGTIVAVQTVKIAHTVCEEPVFYVAAVAQSEHASGEEGDGIEKPSKFLASELTNFAYSCVPINGVVHIVCQSVGYRYANHAGVIHMMKSALGERGRHYWAKHGKPTEQAVLIGAQLALLPDFAEGDCLFLHKELRHLRSMPSIMGTVPLDQATTVEMDANSMLDDGSVEAANSLQDLLVAEQSRHDY